MEKEIREKKGKRGGAVKRGASLRARKRLCKGSGRRGKKHELGGQLGMLISDFPVRSVHLLGERLFGALFPLCG